jgi:GNAT superfamily N-acetyltransferase
LESSSLSFGSIRSDDASIVRFLDEELRAQAGFSVRDEFPAVFQELPGGNSFYAEQNGKIVAHAACLTRIFRHPRFHFKVGLIGSVVTTPEYRGVGLASLLVKTALAELKNSGCFVAILWAENPAMYRALGFERAGREQSLQFSAPEISEDDLGEPVIEYDPKRHAEGVWRLYHQHRWTLDRSLQEMKRLCRVPGTKVFVTLNSDSVTSYLAVQKGLDFPNYIHEWGGRMETVRSNIARVQKQFYPSHNLTLIAPAAYDLSLIRPLAQTHSVGVVGMMKLLDRGRLRAVYLDYLKAVGESNWLDDSWGGDGRSVSTKTDSEFVKAVFGDENEMDHPVLPFFLWGFDSI